MSSSDTEAGRKQAGNGVGEKDAPKKDVGQRPSSSSNARPKPSMMPRKKPD
ncbi:hypothetical protein [Nocardia sp. XZ_19_385]|uniref:hypothetical protein n=1 Tax=Nocardia sp. XZ_19_385 TaxID=2769488 RepID=UPI00188EC4AB|nr:hypothetical protein [Nocardia sp. XZ_19_385]